MKKMPIAAARLVQIHMEDFINHDFDWVDELLSCTHLCTQACTLSLLHAKPAGAQETINISSAAET
jgi:hypothetical protein